MSTSREEFLALALEQDALAQSFKAMCDTEEAHNCRIRAEALRLAATPKAGVDREVIARIEVAAKPFLEKASAWRNWRDNYDAEVHELKATRDRFSAFDIIELADAILALLPSVLGGVDQPSSATKPSPSSTGDSAIECGLNWQISRETKEQIAEIERNAAMGLLNAHKIFAGALPETDAVAPDNAGLVSGGGSEVMQTTKPKPQQNI